MTRPAYFGFVGWWDGEKYVRLSELPDEHFGTVEMQMKDLAMWDGDNWITAEDFQKSDITGFKPKEKE